MHERPAFQKSTTLSSAEGCLPTRGSKYSSRLRRSKPKDPPTKTNQETKLFSFSYKWVSFAFQVLHHSTRWPKTRTLGEALVDCKLSAKSRSVLTSPWLFMMLLLVASCARGSLNYALKDCSSDCKQCYLGRMYSQKALQHTKWR